MTEGVEAGVLFSRGFYSCYGRDLFKPKKLRVEGQIERFPFCFHVVEYGKISLVLELRKNLL